MCGSGRTRHAEVLAKFVGLIEIRPDGLFRCRGCGVEVDVLDVFDAGIAEPPIIDDLGYRIADAVVDACSSKIVDVMISTR